MRKEEAGRPKHGPTLQVLGSGGPMHAGGRADAAYLLWHEGRPSCVLDMGGDTPTKLAAAGVAPGDVPLLIISHVHPDHVSGLPDFLWGEITAERTRPLTVVGPSSAADFHDVEGLFDKLFSKQGAFPDMAALLTGEPFRTDFVVVPRDGRTSLRCGALSIASMAVNHGDVPALAFRIDVGSASIVFAGDQTMDDPEFARFAGGADLLVAHAIATEAAASTPLGRTVATPASIGAMAEKSGASRLLLSHWLGAAGDAAADALWSLDDLDGVVAEIRRHYGGTMLVASDLDCYDVVGADPYGKYPYPIRRS